MTSCSTPTFDPFALVDGSEGRLVVFTDQFALSGTTLERLLEVNEVRIVVFLEALDRKLAAARV